MSLSQCSRAYGPEPLNCFRLPMRGRSGATVDGCGSSDHVRVAHHPPPLATGAAFAVGGGISSKRSRWCGSNHGTRRLVGGGGGAVSAAAGATDVAGSGFGRFFFFASALSSLAASLAVEPGPEDGDDGEDVFRKFLFVRDLRRG